MPRRRVAGLGCALVLALAPIAPAPAAHATQAAVAVAVEPQVDAVFARWTPSTPGCAVGVASGGKPVLAKGYGMSDLEHDVKIVPDTIFEAGSVSKQFTAAAVLLLAHEKKLSLDDPARKYIPELPEYSTPVTIRQMLNHTSGLRDWGNIASIGGWPRTTRVHTHAHVLEIVSRQRATNFTPGTQWSYSNTGFNLAAIIVQRVSGMPFPEFTRTRLFQPLGMTRTSWRDDYTRIVKGRAMAYNSRDDGFHTLMPFENVYGNGGLLTTVGDLLKWNENFTKPVVGTPALLAEQQARGTFNDGRPHGYGLGLFLGVHQGLPEVYHSGSTAGYQAFLTRFPDQRVSVAVLCNSSGAQATQYAHAVADLYLADRMKPAAPAPSLTAQQIQDVAGLYRSATTGLALRIGGSERDATRGRKWTFDGHGRASATDEYGTVEKYERVEPAKYTDEQLAELAGTYTSADAETVLTLVVENHAPVLKRRPDVTIPLIPTYEDAFTAGQLGTMIVRRDANGRPVALSIVQDRVWDLPFTRK